MDTGNTKTLILGTHIVFGATVILIAVASFFADQRLWGIDWYGYFPTNTLLLLCVGAVAGWFITVRSLTLSGRTNPSVSPIPYLLTAGVVCLGAGLLFVVFRAETHFLGDGYLIIEQLAGQQGFTRFWQAGTYYLQSACLSLASDQTNESARMVLQWISYACGWIFLILSALTARLLFDNNLNRLLFFLGLATGGYALLFFGYVEHYPPFVLAVAVLCLTGLLAARGTLSRWWLIPAWLLTAIFHLNAVALIPAVMYLLIADSALGRRIRGARRSVVFAGAGLIVALIAAVFFYLYFSSYFFRFAFMPFYNDPFTVDGYHLFSGKHLLDFANLLLVLFPGLGLMILFLSKRSTWESLKRKDLCFLAIAASGSLVLSFAFQPRLGMTRDWDLFSFSGVPLVMLFFRMVLSDDETQPSGRLAAGLAVVLGLVVLAPRVATQVSVDRSIRLFDSYNFLDPARNRAGRYAMHDVLIKMGRETEARTWATSELNRLKYEMVIEEGVRDIENNILTRVTLQKLTWALKRDPLNARAWRGIGLVYRELGNLDSSLIALRISEALLPNNFATSIHLGLTCYDLGRYDEAEKYLRRSIAEHQSHFQPYAILITIYEKENRQRDASDLRNQCLARQDCDATFDSQLGDFLLERQEYDLAAFAYRRALAKGLNLETIRQREKECPDLHVLGE